MALIEGVLFAPQRLTHALRLVPAAAQALLGAVIQARNALQSKQTRQRESHLIVVAMRVGGIDVAQAAVQIVIIEEGDEVTARFALRADQGLGQTFSMLKHMSDLGRR